MNSVYEKFIAANTALFKCQESVSMESWSAMSPADQDSVCKKEGDVVADFLKNDSIMFKNLIAERLAAWDK
jgi:hypothetical protein